MSTMLNIRKSPHQLLLFTAVVLLLVLVFSLIAKMDFQYIKMFSVPLTTMLWIIPLLLISLWLLYILTDRFLYSVTITRIHVLITVLTTILIMTVLCIGIKPSQEPIDGYELIGTSMQVLFLIFVFAQLFYLANVLLGLFTKKRRNYS